LTNLIITVALCVAVAIAYAIAALIQSRYADRPVAELARVPVLWVALLLNALGAALHVTSLGFGPLSLIQPLGVLTLVIAVPFAVRREHRRVSRLELTGVINTVVGLAGLTLLISTSGTTQILAPHELILLVAATATVVTVLGVLGRQRGASALWEAVAGGIGYSVCSALCQTVVVTVSDHGARTFLQPVMLFAIAAIGVFAVTATLLTHRSYRHGLGAPLAVTNLVNPASATMIGVILLGEHLGTGPVEIVIAALCALLAGLGVTQLTRARDAEVAASPLETVGA
jgi:drug/metabolite transporter (DMT)-like permease